MAELQKVDDWLSALLANLEPAARSRMMRQLAQELRRTQQQNIRMQRNPDGSSYEPRRVTARSKKGRIKRQMFAKLRTTKYLKTAASCVESFFHSLKVECIHGEHFISREIMRATVFNYIECDYNRWRRHSWCGGLSPEQFENKNLA